MLTGWTPPEPTVSTGVSDPSKWIRRTDTWLLLRREPGAAPGASRGEGGSGQRRERAVGVAGEAGDGVRAGTVVVDVQVADDRRFRRCGGG